MFSGQRHFPLSTVKYESISTAYVRKGSGIFLYPNVCYHLCFDRTHWTVITLFIQCPNFVRSLGCCRTTRMKLYHKLPVCVLSEMSTLLISNI